MEEFDLETEGEFIPAQLGERFVQAYERLQTDGRVVSAKEFGIAVDQNKQLITRVKSGQKVTLEQVHAVVRIFNVNPLWFHYERQEFYSEDQRPNNTVNNAGHADVAAPGATNVIHAGSGGIAGNSVIQQAEQIINKMPPGFQQEVESWVSEVKSEIRTQVQQIADLKKRNAEKDEQIVALQGKLIEAHENSAKLSQKYLQLLEERGKE